MTCTLRSSRSPNASARDSGTDRSGSTARYSPASDSTALHAAALVAVGSDANHSVNPSTPGRTSTVRHLRVLAAWAATWSAATRAATRPCGRRDPGRVHRRQPRREVGIHAQAGVDVEPGARLDHLVRARGTGRSPDSTRSRVAGNRSPSAAPSAAFRPASPSVTPVARLISAAAIASTYPTGWTRSHGPDSCIVVSTRAPHAPSTATRPSAQFATACASPASSNASTGPSPRPSAATSRATTAHPSRSAAMRLLSWPLSMPHHTEHPFDTQDLRRDCSPTAEPISRPEADSAPARPDAPDPGCCRHGERRCPMGA